MPIHNMFIKFGNAFLCAYTLCFSLIETSVPKRTAHFYTIFDSMCALRGSLEKVTQHFRAFPLRASIAFVATLPIFSEKIRAFTNARFSN